MKHQSIHKLIIEFTAQAKKVHRTNNLHLLKELVS